MKPLDKKQIPQVIVLAVLAVAFFAYFAMKLILPTPAAARSQPAGTPAAVPTPVAGTPTAPAPAADAALTAPPPSPGMRDPFVPEVTDPATAPPAPVRTASLKGPGEAHPLSVAPLPAIQPLPLPSVGNSQPKGPATASGLAPMPIVVPPPSWTVTGILQSGQERTVILRNGDARRFVKQGDFVDSEYKVIKVTRETVILGHDAMRFVLPLGGGKTAPARQTKPVGTVPAALPLPAAPIAAPKAETISRAVSPVLAVRRTVVAKRHTEYKKLAKVIRRAPYLNPVVRLADYQSGDVPASAPTVSPRGMLPIGTLAPDFSLSTVDGQSLTLSQFQGRPVLLNFWASWDVQSTHMMTSLASLQSEFLHQGLIVVSVNTWDNKDALCAFQNSQHLGGIVSLFDPSVSNDSIAVSLYKVPDVPALYLIDSEGRIAAAFVGHGRSTNSAIKAALAKIGVQ